AAVDVDPVEHDPRRRSVGVRRDEDTAGGRRSPEGAGVARGARQRGDEVVLVARGTVGAERWSRQVGAELDPAAARRLELEDSVAVCVENLLGTAVLARPPDVLKAREHDARRL